MKFLLMSALFLGQALVNAQTFTNPIRSGGADPHIVHDGKYYYMTYTGGSHISVIRATHLAGLSDAEHKEVWRDKTPERSKNFWAPEMHKIDGIWYIFYTAGNGEGKGQRSWVIKGCESNPYDCKYTFQAELTPASGGQGGPDKKEPWSIDGTYLTIGKGRYHVVSAHNKKGVQSIQIAKLDTKAWKVGPWSIISSPTETWEHADPVPNFPKAVNEGPNALYHDGKTWLSFSAASCGSPAYALGLLKYDGSGDPLKASSWKKSGPALKSANGNYGTGHNVFFHSPDKKEIWNAFHATNNSEGSCGKRYALAQIVKFDKSGNPDLGTPPKKGVPVKVPSGDGS